MQKLEEKSLTLAEFTDIARHWAKISLIDKNSWYESSSIAWRKCFACLEADKVALFKAISPRLRLDLFKYYYDEWDSREKHEDLLLAMLGELWCGPSLAAFYYIKHGLTRRTIMRKLNAVSRENVDDYLTRYACEQMEQLSEGVKDEVHIVVNTKILQSSLDGQQRNCQKEGCSYNGRPYSQYDCVVLSCDGSTLHCFCADQARRSHCFCAQSRYNEID
ncbi:hypothetical protein CC80DRAFT_500604 [Byssothecium circinans]|uniref:Uncharacterized protein n=1 Tax=Byssothecium circinans TaxID=147558 RepID=A0A6A5UBJ4_9PLEO|nr:hypothetical protein CC80DRAFT_500604 [Byssothecium circinans]